MIEAWLSASEMTAQSLSRSGSKRPPLASKQAAYRMASSFSWKAASFRSSSLWIVCVPQMKRTEAMPKP